MDNISRTTIKLKKKRLKDEARLNDELNACLDVNPKSVEGKNRMGFESEDYGKLGGMESTSTLFEKVVPVRITKCNCEDRHMDLTARFIMGLSKVHRTTKVLQVQITNELDPFFFYSLEVNEDDFQSLKVEQCILVDFATFPYKFIELLEQCIVSSCNDNPRGMGRFLAVLHLRTGDSTFTVVETNQFKHLSHLSLVFRQGNDNVIKQFLAGRLAEYKTINGDMHEKLRRTLHSLEKALRDVNSMSSELGELKENQCRNISELKAEFTLELAHEKEKVMQETAELKDRLERERADLECRLRQQVDQHQERACDLDKQVRSLLDTKYKLDTRITELKSKFSTVEKELEEKLQECERLRKDNRDLDTEKHEAAKQLNRHLIRLSALEQEVSDKNELLSNLTMQLDAQASHRAALEGSWKEAQAAADRAEERASASASELNKCYQIIEKLQVELRSSKQKVKLKGQVTSQQDNLLSERQAAIEKAQSDNISLRNELARLKVEQDENKKKSEELSGKLDEAQNLLQSNQQMIQWLNQQLTEAQLGKLPGSAASSRYNTFTRSNTSGLCYSSCLTNNRPGEATTPLSSNSSLGGNSGSTAFKSQFPMSSPYLSSTATPFSGVPTIQVKPQQSGLGVFHSTPSMAGSQRSMYVPVTKNALQATQKVQYKPKSGLTTASAVTGVSNLCSYTEGTMPMESSQLNSWDDSGSWGSKHNILPRPQLSFADRSGYANLTKSSITIGRPNSNLTTGDGCQSNCSRPPSPNQQSPSGRLSPSMMPAGDRSELSHGREATLVGSSTGGGEPNVGDTNSRSAGNGGDNHQPQSPKANNRPESPPAPRQSSAKGHGDRGSSSPSRTKTAKSPPNRSPQRSHFSRR